MTDVYIYWRIALSFESQHFKTGVLNLLSSFFLIGLNLNLIQYRHTTVNNKALSQRGENSLSFVYPVFLERDLEVVQMGTGILA